MTLQAQIKTKLATAAYHSFQVRLDDGAMTTVHVAAYARAAVRPRLQSFEKETVLLDWCSQSGVTEAISGGFFSCAENMPLGDMWINGVQQKTIPFISPWHHSRGSLYISPVGGLTIAPRYILPPRPRTDLLQAGPLLVQNGQSVISESEDPEGFSEGAAQFDNDISAGRFPRSAIGTNRDYIFNVLAGDGYRETEAGLTFQEFAQLLRSMGITDALNLDGGSSATLIAGGKLRNKPCSPTREYKKGRPIFSAVLFETI